MSIFNPIKTGKVGRGFRSRQNIVGRDDIVKMFKINLLNKMSVFAQSVHEISDPIPNFGIQGIMIQGVFEYGNPVSGILSLLKLF